MFKKSYFVSFIFSKSSSKGLDGHGHGVVELSKKIRGNKDIELLKKILTKNVLEEMRENGDTALNVNVTIMNYKRM